MEDTRLYAMLLGIDFPWRISRVQVDMASERIDVGVEEAAGRGGLWAGGGRTSGEETWGVMMEAVPRGLSRKERRVPVRIGIDEKSVGKGHDYESLVCDLDRGTVEYVVDDRKQESLESYFLQFTKEELSQIEAIAMDMWEPYVLATQAS